MVKAKLKSGAVKVQLTLSEDVAKSLHSVTAGIVGDGVTRQHMDDIFYALDKYVDSDDSVRFQIGDKTSTTVTALGGAE